MRFIFSTIFLSLSIFAISAKRTTDSQSNESRVDSVYYFLDKSPTKSLFLINQILNETNRSFEQNKNLFLLKGNILCDLGAYNLAIEGFNSLYRNAIKENRKQVKITALRNLGIVYRKTGDYDKAFEYFEKALRLINDKSDPNVSAEQFILLANTYKEMHDYKEAKKNTEVAIRNFKRVGDSRGIAEGYNMLGSIAWNKSDFNSALANYKSALELRIPLNEPDLLAASYTNIGLCYKAIGDFELALKNYKLALEIFVKSHSMRGLGDVYNHMGSLYWSFDNASVGLSFYKKSLENRIELKNPDLIAASYENIGNAYKTLNQYDTALYYLNQALSLRKQIGILTGIANTHTKIGNVYWCSKNYSNALIAQFNALRIYEEINDPDGKAKTYKNIGLIYKALENYSQAISFFHLSSEIHRERQNLQGFGNDLNNIGSLYYAKGDYQKALEYYRKSLDVRSEIGNQRLIELVLVNIANSLMQLGMQEESFEKYKESLEINIQTANSKRTAFVYHQMGNAYKKFNDPKSAFHYYLKAYNGASSIQYYYIAALSARKIAEYYYSKNLLEKSYEYALKSLEISAPLQEKEFKKHAYNILYNIFLQQNNHRQAMKYLQRFNEVNEQLLKEKYNQDIFNTQLEIESAINQNEIDKIQGEIEVVQREKKIQEQLKTFLALLVLLVLIILVLYINRFRLKKRSAELLQEKINEINVINLRLKDSEKSLLESNKTKDKFFSILAHDLRNPFSGLIGISDLLNKKVADYESEDIKRYSGMLKDSIIQVYGLLENLLEWSMNQMNHITVKEERFELKDLVHKNIVLVQANANKKNIRINFVIPDYLVALADKNTINTVIRNLLSNAVKYTKQNGEISIKAEEHNSHIQICIIDNGIGISKENVLKLFELNEQISTKGTRDEGGSGLGLVLCKEFVSRNGGEIWVESEPNKGSVFYFTVKKYV